MAPALTITTGAPGWSLASAWREGRWKQRTPWTVGEGMEGMWSVMEGHGVAGRLQSHLEVVRGARDDSRVIMVKQANQPLGNLALVVRVVGREAREGLRRVPDERAKGG